MGVQTQLLLHLWQFLLMLGLKLVGEAVWEDCSVTGHGRPILRLHRAILFPELLNKPLWRVCYVHTHASLDILTMSYLRADNENANDECIWLTHSCPILSGSLCLDWAWNSEVSFDKNIILFGGRCIFITASVLTCLHRKEKLTGCGLSPHTIRMGKCTGHWKQMDYWLLLTKEDLLYFKSW